VTGVIGGLLAAILWGTSTVAASRSTRMIGSQQVLGYVMLTGFVLTGVAAPAIEGIPDVGAHGAAWALLAGVASVFGLSMMYRALRIGKVGVVAPIASTEGALAALFSVVLLGQSLSGAVAIALAVVALGVVTVTFHGSLHDLELRPSLYAFTAAAVFGVGLIASAQAGDAIGSLWTILVARVVGLAIVVAPLLLRGDFPWPRGRALPLVIFSGFAEVAGFAGYIIGARDGVAVPAVLASQFAAVAAFASFLIFGERLTRVQLSGALVIAAGVAAVAALRV
jgi:drug/metabolite transporter (DMT)-like permease